MALPSTECDLFSAALDTLIDNACAPGPSRPSGQAVAGAAGSWGETAGCLPSGMPSTWDRSPPSGWASTTLSGQCLRHDTVVSTRWPHFPYLVQAPSAGAVWWRPTSSRGVWSPASLARFGRRFLSRLPAGLTSRPPP